jgi:hypothetical protein
MGLHGILGRVVMSTVMAAHHCYAICNEQRWWSDTLWATLMRLWLHSLLCYLQIVVAENFLQFHGCIVWKGTQGHGAQWLIFLQFCRTFLGTNLSAEWDRFLVPVPGKCIKNQWVRTHGPIGTMRPSDLLPILKLCYNIPYNFLQYLPDSSNWFK